MKEKKIITAVLGIVKHNEKFLIAKRPPHVSMPGFWEFPGGKIEPGETPQAALIRELQEEVGIDVRESTFIMNEEHILTDRIIRLSLWLVTAFAGEAYSREGQDICWVKASEFSQYEFLPTNTELLKHLTLSRLHKQAGHEIQMSQD